MPNTQPQCLPPEPVRLVAVPASDPPDGLPAIEFDATARVAAALLGAPLAFVALRDSPRLWCQAGAGLEPDNLPIDGDLVAALQADGGDAALVVIEDLHQDRHWCERPLATGAAALRFYAGASVVDSAGQVVATVGVLDLQPRRLDAAQARALRDLATVVKVALQARQHAADLARQAMLDPATGTASRRQFDRALDVEMHHAMRTGEPFTLLRLSLDGLIDIRNGFGHAAADGSLRELAARLIRQVRVGDVLARLGGDEFAVVMRHGAAAEAEVLARRIVNAVREPLVLDSGDVVGVRVCIGIAAYADDVESSAALLGHAEQALQQARRQHEQRWNFFGRKFEAPPLRLVAGDERDAVGADLAPRP